MITVIALEVISKESKNFSYIIFKNDSQECIIVDPAWEMAKIEEQIKKYSLKPAHILLTHGHEDHIDLASNFAEIYDSKIWMFELEVKNYQLKFPNLCVFQKTKRLNCGSFDVRPIHTPGHTMGSVCYQIDNCLFTGDTLFIEGCGMCFEANSDPGMLYESLMFLKQEIAPDVKIYPGHRYGLQPGQSFDFVLKHNVYFHFHDKNKFIAFRMRPNQTNWFRYI